MNEIFLQLIINKKNCTVLKVLYVFPKLKVEKIHYQAVTMGYQVVTIGYQAITIGYQAVTIGYQAVTIGYQAVTIGY